MKFCIERWSDDFRIFFSGPCLWPSPCYYVSFIMYFMYHVYHVVMYVMYHVYHVSCIMCHLSFIIYYVSRIMFYAWGNQFPGVGEAVPLWNTDWFLVRIVRTPRQAWLGKNSWSKTQLKTLPSLENLQFQHPARTPNSGWPGLRPVTIKHAVDVFRRRLSVGLVGVL